MNNAEFRDWVERCLEGSATPEEERAVVDAATSSPRRARFLRLVVVFDAALRTLPRDADAFARRVVATLGRDEDAEAFARRARRRIEREEEMRQSRMRRPAAWRLRSHATSARPARWAAAAAVLLAAAVLILLVRGGPGDRHETPGPVTGVSIPSLDSGAVASSPRPDPVTLPRVIEVPRARPVPGDGPIAREPSAASAPSMPAPPSQAPETPVTPVVPAVPTPSVTAAVIASVESVVGGVAMTGPGADGPAVPTRSLVSGQGIVAGEGARCVLSLVDGTRLEAEPGVRLSIFAADPPDGTTDRRHALRIDMSAGRLSASVSRQPAGRPLVIATPHAEAAVLGTSLSITIEAEATRLDVQEGRVRFTRGADRCTADVKAGQYAVAGPRFALAVLSQSGRVRAVATGAPSRPVLFPPDAGHVDVRLTYGAKGDGVTDDTDAIQRAIADHMDTFNRLIYLPNGTYRITRPLEGRNADGRYHFGMQLIGQSREKTVIRLDDRCPGYQDPGKPRAAIVTAMRDGLEGNEAYRNAVMNLTVDTGSGNPGAVGIDYLAQGSGAIRDVTVRSGNGGGRAGIAMTRRWPGPCLVKNVLVSGFDVGIDVAYREFGVTLEHVTLEGQREAGLRYSENVLAVRGLVSHNACPAISGGGAPSLLVLLDARLTGGAPDAAAVVARGGSLIARNVRTDGYGAAARVNGDAVPAGALVELTAGLPRDAFPATARTLDLPVEDPPDVPVDDPSLWERVNGTGSTAIQKAIDSGKPVVYLPFGQYWLDQPVRVRGSVRRIVGMMSLLHPQPALGEQPVLRFDGPQKAVAVEFLMGSGWIEHASPGAVSLRHLYGFRYRNAKGCGSVFAEDISLSPWRMDHPQQAWLRSWTTFGDDVALRNDGGTAWVFGLRSGGAQTVAESLRGAATEILGACIYPATPVPDGRPMFRSVDARLGVAVAPRSYIQGGIHRVLVAEGRGEAHPETPTPPGPVAHATAMAPGTPASDSERRTQATPAALAAWDARLVARVRGAVAEGRRVRFACSLVGSDAEILGVDDRDGLQVRSGTAAATVPWVTLSLEDRRHLALAVLRDGEADDHAVAAFYHLACGMTEKAQEHLRRAGNAAEDVRAAFR